eukprot:9368551-Alexandrium_andersonii.AAC.1
MQSTLRVAVSLGLKGPAMYVEGLTHLCKSQSALAACTLQIYARIREGRASAWTDDGFEQMVGAFKHFQGCVEKFTLFMKTAEEGDAKPRTAQWTEVLQKAQVAQICFKETAQNIADQLAKSCEEVIAERHDVPLNWKES